MHCGKAVAAPLLGAALSSLFPACERVFTPERAAHLLGEAQPGRLSRAAMHAALDATDMPCLAALAKHLYLKHECIDNPVRGLVESARQTGNWVLLQTLIDAFADHPAQMAEIVLDTAVEAAAADQLRLLKRLMITYDLPALWPQRNAIVRLAVVAGSHGAGRVFGLLWRLLSIDERSLVARDCVASAVVARERSVLRRTLGHLAHFRPHGVFEAALSAAVAAQRTGNMPLLEYVCLRFAAVLAAGPHVHWGSLGRVREPLPPLPCSVRH